MTGPDQNDRPRNEGIEETLNEIGKIVAGQLPPGWGFNLLLFNFGEKGATFYISNADRSSMIEAMKEFIDKLEQGEA